jgi:hypothetical protein
MDSITIGFSRPKSGFHPFSWLIRLAYWSPFSHAYVKFDIPKIGNVIFQASGMKVNLIGEDLFNSKEFIYEEFALPITKKRKIELVKFAVGQLGKPYNVVGILGMVYVRAGQLFGIHLNSPFPYTGSSDFCSEVVAHILETYEDLDLGNVADDSPQAVCYVLERVTGESA